MTAIIPPVNTALQTADQIINFAYFKLTFPAMEAAAIAYAPFLGWPIIKQIFTFFFEFYGSKFLYIPTVDYTNMVIITKQTADEQKAYSLVEGTLRKAVLTGDQNAIAQANAAFNAKLKALITFDGFATPIK